MLFRSLDNHDSTYFTNADNLSSGTVPSARLTAASTSGSGIVQLSNSHSGTSETVAVTEKALSDGLATMLTKPAAVIAKDATSYSFGTTYQASASGYLIVTGKTKTDTTSSSVVLNIYAFGTQGNVDSELDSVKRGAQSLGHTTGLDLSSGTLTIPVIKGEYFRVVATVNSGSLASSGIVFYTSTLE